MNVYMVLDDTARERLEDVRDLQPTSNAELRDRWGMDSGSEVAAYLRDELGEHTYRDDESRIRAVPAEDSNESPQSMGPEAGSKVSRSGATALDGDSSGEDDPNPSTSTGMSESGHGNQSGQQTAGNGNPEADQDVLRFTQEEYDELIAEVRAAAYQEGFEDGLSTAKNQVDGGSDEIELRCGCESFDPDSYDMPVVLECDTCGDTAEYYAG